VHALGADRGGTEEQRMPDVTAARRRTLAAIAALVAGFWAIGWAIWTPFLPPEQSDTVRNFGAWWAILAVGGALAVASVFVTSSSIPTARAMLVVAALVLAAGVAVFGDYTPAALTRHLLPAAVMLLAAPFLGPVPRYGSERRGAGASRH
jgi:hypothetical protein